MPVPTLISQLSTTASLNSPDGAVDVPSSIDDYQRAHAAFIAQLYAGTVAAPTVIVPSATTTDIGAAASENVDISGTATITGFGIVAEGINRKGRFTGVLTLTHNATSLILPGNANITTAANDRYEARSLGGGNWIVTKYQYASGLVRSVDIQNQTVTAFTTSGTSTAFTLTPTPAITANAAKQRFMAVLHTAPIAGAVTMAVSGQAALNFIYYDPVIGTQFVTSAQAPANYPCDIYNDGTNWVLMNPIGGSSAAIKAKSPIAFTASATLDGTHVGVPLYYNSASAGTLTLSGTAVVDDAITVYNLNTGICTIARAGSQVIYAKGLLSATSITLSQGESVTLVFNGGNWIQAIGTPGLLGTGQTWQAVTRTSGTTYYNTTNSPLEIKVQITSTASNTGQVALTVNGTSAGLIASAYGFTSTGAGCGTAVIPPGASYVLTDTNIASRTTYELR